MINLNSIIDNILNSYNTDGGTNLQEKYVYPNRENVVSVLKDIQAVIFPGFHQAQNIDKNNLKYVIGEKLSRIANVLTKEIEKALLYAFHENPEECKKHSEQIVDNFINEIPLIRKKACKDAQAALNGDPAARSIEEIILSYPGPEAILVYRIAHFLHTNKVPIIPRIMSEYIHGKTGIDIHPGAEIGESFFIDHGTGVVVGETCIIGNNVKLYQGVTLGALSVKKEMVDIK